MVIARTLYHTDFHKGVVLAGISVRSEEYVTAASGLTNSCADAMH